MSNNLTKGKEAVQGLLNGIELAVNAIKGGYGNCGTNVLVEHELYPYHVIANDCETIVQALHTDIPQEKIGLEMFKELSAKADKDSADGRKTTLLMAYAIIKHGLDSTLPPVQLKRELDSFIPLIEAKINSFKRDINENEIGKVAAIAGESEEIGEVLQDIYKRIGRDGIIIPEGSGTYHTEYIVINGVRFIDTGYLSPYMVYDEQAAKEGRKETKAVYENPVILVTKRKIERDSDIAPILDHIIKANKPLVIFANDMDSGVAMRMVATHKAKVAKILVIKAPTLWNNYVYEDFAKITGATIVEDASGVTFKSLKLDHLGTCDRIEVDKDETIITGGADISEHIAQLKTQDDTDSKLRLSWLCTKTAVLKLGANNESELSYKRLKCSDAINSSRLALKDGVVQGGGICLYDVSRGIFGSDTAMIIANALQAPLIQICENSGCTQDDFMKQVSPDILDASAVIKNAVRNAISLASTVLTSPAIIHLPKKSPEQIAAEAMQQRGMRF